MDRSPAAAGTVVAPHPALSRYYDDGVSGKRSFVRRIFDQTAGDYFDFLSMGYALRHLSDLSITFREFFRVLKPGGRACVLEISRPKTRLRRAAIKAYMRWIVPAVTRLATRHADSQLLWQYYWDTIEACVPAETVTAALSAAGFEDASHHCDLGLFSEYFARKPK